MTTGALLLGGVPAAAREPWEPFSTLPPRPPDFTEMLRPRVLPVVTGDDVRVSTEPNHALAEVIIDVNPLNPSNIALCGYARDIKSMSTFHSFDGGATWSYVSVGDAHDGLGPLVDRYDPTLVFDAAGYLYVGYGARVPDGLGFIDHLLVARSDDGGATFHPATTVWIAPSVLGNAGNDKFHLAVGPERFNKAQNVLMMAWTLNIRPPLGSVDQQIVFARSLDAGLTFSDPVVINDDSIQDRDFAIYADPAIGPDGVMYVAWQDLNTNELMVDHTFDNGVTWGVDVVVEQNVLPFRTRIPPQPNRGVFCGPVLDADMSGGAYHGRLYLVYCHGSVEDTDILLRFSDDHANSFSPPLRVNDDPPGSHQFLPWVDVNQTNGRVNVIFYDTRADTMNHRSVVHLAASDTGAESFYQNAPVADVPSNNGGSNPNRYAGNFLEYIGVAAWGDDTFVAWTDTRNAPDPLTDYYFDLVPPDPTPPDADIALTPSVLAPPNGQWVGITATVTLTDEQDPAPTRFALHEIVSDEPGGGEGNDVKDAEFGTPDLAFSLRAAQNGRGRARVYTVVYRSVDASGNAGLDSAYVVVPGDIPTAAADDGATPGVPVNAIRSVEPNPTRHAATVAFETAEAGRVRVAVVDVRGRVVARLTDSYRTAGPHTLQWDGRNGRGSPVASGVYFVLMEAGSFRAAHRVVVLR